MIYKNRLLFFSLTLLIVISIMGLAAGLNAVNFQSGRSFWVSGGSDEISRPEFLEPTAGNSPLAKVVGLLGVIIVALLPVGLFFMIIDPKRRKRILIILIQVIILYLAALGLKNSATDVEETSALSEFASESVGSYAAGCGDPGIQSPLCNQAPEWAVILISASAVIAFAIIARFIYKQFFQPTPLEKIVKEAQNTINSLRAGADVSDAIRRCYFEMSETLRKEHNIRRSQAMTTREFEELMEQSGLPYLHVRDLTRLFERVRYGAKSPSQTDEQQAVESLTAIVQAAPTGGGV